MQCASSCSCGTHKPALIGELPCSHSQPAVRHGELVRRELTAVANSLAQISYNKSADGVVLLCPGQAVIETAMLRQDDVDSNLCPRRLSWTRGRGGPALMPATRAGRAPAQSVAGLLRAAIGRPRAFPLSC